MFVKEYSIKCFSKDYYNLEVFWVFLMYWINFKKLSSFLDSRNLPSFVLMLVPVTDVFSFFSLLHFRVKSNVHQ